MIRYAAYGSNLHPVRLTERIPAARLLGTGFVQGLSLHFHKRSPDGSGKCTIGQHGNGVYLAVYEFQESDKQKLDDIEGLGDGYEKSSIEIPEFGSCHTYVGAESHLRDELVPYDWYRELVVLGCRKLAFPDWYASGVQSVAATPDPDEARNRRQWQLVERLRANL